MTFGSEIQRLRKQKGLKQYELAEKLGFKSAYLCDIENGRRKPQSNKFIENVCEVLELTDKERKHLYELSYNLPENITNKKQELLSQIANMELRDQLEAKEQMIKNLKEKLEIAMQTLEYLSFDAKRDDDGLEFIKVAHTALKRIKELNK